mgnify:CR=1 FL=1
MAGLTYIPALVRDLTDAEAEDAAITENLQREDVRPREEAAAYKRALQSGRHTSRESRGKFGKSEAYIRSRLKLCELIDALAEMLDKEDISVGAATEIAKYPAEIQQESTTIISPRGVTTRGRRRGSRRSPGGSTSVT